MEGKSQIISMLISRFAKHMHDLMANGIHNTDNILEYSMNYWNQLTDHINCYLMVSISRERWKISM